MFNPLSFDGSVISCTSTFHDGKFQHLAVLDDPVHLAIAADVESELQRAIIRALKFYFQAYRQGARYTVDLETNPENLSSAWIIRVFPIH